MIADETRKKLQDIVRGAGVEGGESNCTTIRNLLCQSFETGTTIKSEFESRAIIKEEQAAFLKTYAQSAGLWLESLLPANQYLTRGGEAEIYLAFDKRHVIKVNDAVYYATWTEFFNSLVIHNLLFPNTFYTLIGFTHAKDTLQAVLQQLFVEGETAELDDIKEFLLFNGFINTRRQDYYNEEFGLVLEDMHDENIIASNGFLFFIDTVFYIIPNK